MDYLLAFILGLSIGFVVLLAFLFIKVFDLTVQDIWRDFWDSL